MRLRFIISISLFALVCAPLAACGGVDAAPPDAAAGPDTAAPPDATAPPDTTPPDAAPPPREARELTGAGGRAAGGGYTIDFQLGHAFTQSESTGGGLELAGGAAVRP